MVTIYQHSIFLKSLGEFRKTFFLIFVIIMLLVDFSYGQFVNEEQLSYISSRSERPIEIEVKLNRNKVSFYATNHSYFDYIVNLEFSRLVNFNEYKSFHTQIAGFGSTHLFSLTKKDPDAGHDYSYNYSYCLKPSEDIKYNFEYLHPTGSFCLSSDNIFEVPNDSCVIIYKISLGDTIFAMRKGLVVAIPEKRTNEDRLLKQNSIEVLHEDGTVMLYSPALEEDIVLVESGKTVYPGQPILIVNTENRNIAPRLCTINKGGRISLNKFYLNCCELPIDDFCRPNKPYEIIKKEMTNHEKKKYSKGKLF